MSAYNYGQMIKTAKRLIDRFGGKVVIVTTVMTPDPSGDWKPPVPMERTDTVKGVLLEYEIKDVDGTLVLRGDQYILVSALGLEFPPDLTGVVTINDTDKWNIVKISPLAPSGEKIIFTIQVRQ